MSMDVLSRCFVGAGMLLLLPGLGYALEVDTYIGFGAGYAVQKQTTGDNTADTAGKAYIGSRFLGPLGVEIAYYNFGKYNNGSDEVTVVSATAVANLDIRGMTLFAKGGVVEWTKTDLINDTEITGEDITYGFGINLPVDRHILFRTELEYFKDIGKDNATGAPGQDMSILTFGMNFKF